MGSWAGPRGQPAPGQAPRRPLLIRLKRPASTRRRSVAYTQRGSVSLRLMQYRYKQRPNVKVLRYCEGAGPIFACALTPVRVRLHARAREGWHGACYAGAHVTRAGARAHTHAHMRTHARPWAHARRGQGRDAMRERARGQGRAHAGADLSLFGHSGRLRVYPIDSPAGLRLH